MSIIYPIKFTLLIKNYRKTLIKASPIFAQFEDAEIIYFTTLKVIFRHFKLSGTYSSRFYKIESCLDNSPTFG